MDWESFIVLFLIALIKLAFYGFYILTKRLHKIERSMKNVQDVIAGLHQREFAELKDSLHRINTTMLDAEERALDIKNWGLPVSVIESLADEDKP